jgi:hypothetical protein
MSFIAGKETRISTRLISFKSSPANAAIRSIPSSHVQSFISSPSGSTPLTNISTKKKRVEMPEFLILNATKFRDNHH